MGDFEQIDNTLVMHIRAGTNQRLKTASSARRVPIHPSLIRLGLVDLIEHQRSRKEVRLFPDLERDDHRGKLSTDFTDEFHRYRKSVGLYQPRMDFHSFRKGVNQSLIDRDVTKEVREALLGHRDSSINIRNYSNGFPVGQLRAAIFALDFNVSRLRNPFQSGDASKVTHVAAAVQRLRIVNP